MKKLVVTDDAENEFYSEDEDDDNDKEEQFAKLHESVSQLDTTQRVKSAKRNELGGLISEYHVNAKGKNDEIATTELAAVLKKKKNKLIINKKLDRVKKLGKTLPKPLEKPVAELIKRKVGFEVVKEQLKSWDPVVESHRVADHLVFPLNEPGFFIQENNEYFKRTTTTLEKELNAVLHGEQPEPEKVEQDEFPLTLEEMVERRKELAGIRAKQSFKEAKAYRQSKIKSKKYHRIQKREKIKQQMKEFELLQKTDPAAALKKLEELERGRAEERASLRHRNTGKWAKSLAVRAKYDRDSRKVLSEQLSISRDITAKTKPVDSSDDEGEPDPNVLKTALEIAETNPWSLEVTSDVNSFISGFRKYWNDKNGKPEEEKKEVKKDEKTAKSGKPQTKRQIEKTVKNTKEKSELKLGGCGNWEISPAASDSRHIKRKITDFDIDDAFYLADKKLADKISKKFKTLQGKIKSASPNLKKKMKKTKRPEPGLKMKKSRWHVERAQVDQELGDTSLEENNSSVIQPMNSIEPSKTTDNPSQIDIDPDKFLKVKPKVLKTPLPDEVTGDDEAIDEEDQQQVIMEAFADDNVVDFKKAKEEAEQETKVEVVAELPGWGSWGGAGLVPSKRRRRRFLKIPELPLRKDHQLQDVIINEQANPKIKNHMVKEIPFPFKSVEAFESNIRAPVSRDWVPELTHKDLVLPDIITRQGTIIEPLSDDVLIRNRPKAKSVFKGKVKSKQSV